MAREQIYHTMNTSTAPYVQHIGKQQQQQPPNFGQPQVITFKHDRRGCVAWTMNFIWVLLGGWHMFLTWFITGCLLCLTCIGVPCGWQAIKISLFLLFPFGTRLTYTHENTENEGSQCCIRGCNCILNVIWAATVGWVLALQALIAGLLLMLTIVGIPFGWQCFKLTYLCFCPFGMDFTAEEEETVYVQGVTTPTAALPQHQPAVY